MTEHQLYWLLAQAFIAQRLGHLGTGILPIHHAIRDALDATGKLPRPADNCTDSEVREAFRGGSEQGEPRKSGGPVSPGSTYIVGEPGSELFISNEGGTIVPNVEPTGNSVVNIDTTNLDAATDEDVTTFVSQLNKPKRKGK